MPALVVRYDLRLPGTDPRERKRLLDAALEQIAWADRQGLSAVVLSEHHGSVDGYLPSPIVFGAAAAACTTRIRISLAALVAGLHDPLRLAEDLAVLDLISGGRLVVTIGAGYVADEFAMLGKPFRGRGAAVEQLVSTLRRAWTGEPFALDGRTVRVTPAPYQPGGPPLLLGGSSAAAAQRAARLGVGFLPAVADHFEHYRAAVISLGRPDPGPFPPLGPRFIHVADDPEAAWARIAAYCLHETNAYAAWAAGSGIETGYAAYPDADALRRSGRYPVLTPDETLQLARELGPAGTLMLHPLAGGMDPDLSWESLRLVESTVLPALRGEGLLPTG